jgi:transglutaminase-like putative cysteine protease
MMISRLELFARKELTWYRLVSIFFFLVAMAVLTFMIGRLDRSIHLKNLRQIFLIAALVGLAFSIMKNPKPLLLILLSLSSSVVVAFTITGNLFQRFITFLQAGMFYVLALIQERKFPEQINPDPHLLQEEWRSLAQSIKVLGNRLLDWLVSLPEPAYDPVSINLAWGIVVWLATIWLFWFVIERRQALIGFIPLLGITAGSVSTIDSGLAWLALMLGIGILLMVLGKQIKLEEFWEDNQFTTSDRIRGIAVQYAIFLSAAIVLFAGLITSPKLDDLIRKPRQRVQDSGDGTNGYFKSSALEEEVASGPREVLQDAAKGWLPNVHLVGSGPELAEIEVFHAKVREQSSDIVPGYYFRSATYETFTLRGWQNIGKDTVLVSPEEEIEIAYTPNQNLIFQEITLLQDFPKGNLMYVVGELTATNVPYYGSYHTKFVNNTYKDLFASVTFENQYRAYSATPYFGEDDLRNSSQEYPSWIQNKFLKVPDSTPDRVFDLAILLTATQPTPYDRALAIESYLRTYEYTLDIDAPPKNRDIVDLFLFDLQKGYCDYFASSMVILARAAGLPTRLATGYLASTYDPEAAQFIVTADQAHSWAEVYFPDYGWVTFEPTAGRPALDRQSQRDLLPEDLALEPEFEDRLHDEITSRINLVPENLSILFIEISILLIGGLLVFQRVDRWQLSRMEPDRLFSVMYQRLRKFAKIITVETDPSDTPLEFADSLKKTLLHGGEKRIFQTYIISISQKAAIIIEVCNHAAYASSQIDLSKRQEVIHLWGHLRWQLIQAGSLIRVQSIGANLRRIWLRLSRKE